MQVALALPDDADAGCESLWAEDLGGGRYRLRNSPFAAYGYSFDDVVTTRQTPDGTLRVTGLAVRSGHSTYRIFLAAAASLEGDEIWPQLAHLGCTFERATARLFAIDVPPRADIHRAYELLAEGEARGSWELEEAHSSHVVDGRD